MNLLTLKKYYLWRREPMVAYVRYICPACAFRYTMAVEEGSGFRAVFCNGAEEAHVRTAMREVA